MEWYSLEEWPREGEMRGLYWSGLALLEATKDSSCCDAYMDFITYDAGVAHWWAIDHDHKGDLDIVEESRIIALLYIPDIPERFEERQAEARRLLREKYGRWH